MDNTDTLFSPDREICRINREAVILLGGGRSILMQLAHPLVAAGVADYSNFQSDPLARLFRTLRFMHTVLFDDRGREEALRRFQRMHTHIRGHLDEPAGIYPAGTPYSGDDPRLKVWVHATFVDTTLITYERFLPPLTPDQRQRYYRDSLTLARVLNIPEDLLPQTLEEFRAYMDRSLKDDTLVVTDAARRLAKEVLHPHVEFIPSMSAALLRFVTAGLLPEPLRSAYNLPWNKKHEFVLDSLGHITRFLRPITPPFVWQGPLHGGYLTRALLNQVNMPAESEHGSEAAG